MVRHYIYDTTEEAVAMQILICRDAMTKLFSVLKRFELQWCQLQPYSVVARYPPEQQPVRGKFVIQINLMRHTEGGNVFVFKVIQGYSLPAMDTMHNILTELCPP